MSVPRTNPISAIQAQLDLSDNDFSQVLEVSVITLRTVKAGRTVYPRSVYDGLEALGYCSESLDGDYQEYRRQVRESLLASIER